MSSSEKEKSHEEKAVATDIDPALTDDEEKDKSPG